MSLDELSFRLRSAFPFSLPAFKRTVTFESLTLPASARERALELLEANDRATWAGCCNAQDWPESLYALDVLRRVLPSPLPEGRGLEVGAKNGSMLPGFVTAVRRGCDAVELDAHRRYLWGSTRRVYGEAMARAFPDCRFIAGDVRSLEGPWAVVTWWLPFLTAAPLEAWGLPGRFLAPLELLTHVCSRVVPGGVVFIVNQGEAEHELQGRLFREAGLEAKSLGQIESVLSPFLKPRFGWLWRRASG